jgi:tryptophan halogenase
MNTTTLPIKSYVIVGGGTAGWLTAAILARVLAPLLKKNEATITLIESPEVSSIGVGEATVPSFVDILNYLDISMQDFVTTTNATFKLGIKFTDWQKAGESYWHPFGNVGAKINGWEFFQHWLKAHLNGDLSKYTDFSPCAVMAQAGKFYIPDAKKPNNLSTMGYALHFDASKVANYLANYSQVKGVVRIQAHVETITKHLDGRIKSLIMKDGQKIEGDFFVDCTGQRALLIGETLDVEYEDWSHYLPVNRAVVVQSELAPTETVQSDVRKTIPPYTEAFAHEHGWRWQIPLQNRIGNGYVYASDYCSEQEATDLLLKNLKGKALTEPRTIKFTTGKRKKMWHKNCVAIGLSSGFLEPLESTSIYLIMRAALNFATMLPNQSLAQETEQEYNRLMDLEYQCLRDFIVTHYCTSKRTDSKFWQDWQSRKIPPSLQTKLALYKSQGRLVRNDNELFGSNSWHAVLSGMGTFPLGYDPVVDATNVDESKQYFKNVSESLAHSVNQLLTHDEYLERLKTK